VVLLVLDTPTFPSARPRTKGMAKNLTMTEMIIGIGSDNDDKDVKCDGMRE